jgi:tetratricopeptide (TPR) repeat protein
LDANDYVDHETIARCLRRLEQLDFELLLARLRLGQPRPRMARLAAAIERLAGASVNAHLTLLRERLGQDRLNVAHEAATAGDRAWERGKGEAACAYYQLALLAMPGEGAPIIHRPRLWLRLADLAERIGDLSSAREAVTQGLAEMPTAARAELAVFQQRLAELALAMNDLGTAALCLGRSLRGLSGKERAVWYATAAALRERQGDHEAATHFADRALACDGADDWARVRACVVRARQATRPEEMHCWLLKAALRAPDDTQPRELAPLFALLTALGLCPPTEESR